MLAHMNIYSLPLVLLAQRPICRTVNQRIDDAVLFQLDSHFILAVRRAFQVEIEGAHQSTNRLETLRSDGSGLYGQGIGFLRNSRFAIESVSLLVSTVNQG